MPRASDRLRTLFSAPDRLLWAVRVRWLTIGGFLLLAIVAHGAGLFASIAPCVQVAVVGSVLNTVNGWCIRHRRHVLAVSAIAIPMDHVFTTYLVVHTGGTQSPFVVLYIVQVLATAMLVDTVVAAGSALLATALLVTALRWQLAGTVTPILPAASTTSQAIWAGFLFYCLTLLVYLGGYISERLRSSEENLTEQNRRLEDTLGSLQTTHRELGQAYSKLQHTEAQLIQSEKLRGLGELVAGVAHELNNPITFVAGNVDHLRTYISRLRQLLDAYAASPLPDPDRLRIEAARRELRVDDVLADLPGLLDDCAEGARRTKQIVTELRTFARGADSDAWQYANLHHGIDSTLALLAHRLKDRITVHRNYGDLPEVECVAGQLNQVFMNLLANAADAIGDQGGDIWIATQLTGDQERPVAEIRIRDDGRGMSSDVQTRVFDPFFTTKPVGAGTGLGLSVSYGIIARHHGTLSVESEPGAGAVFTLRLPCDRTRL